MFQVRQEGDGKFDDVYKCGKWVHGSCAKRKRVTSTLAKGFVCELCVDTMEGIVDPGEEISFFDQVDL